MINKIASNWLGNKFVFYPSLEIHMQFSSSFASCRLWRDVRTSKTYLINVQPSTDLLASGLGSKKKTKQLKDDLCLHSLRSADIY